MRLHAPSLILALVALGGVALAQPVLVEDPWPGPATDGSSWFAPTPEPPRAELPVEAVLYDPWAKTDPPKSETPSAATNAAPKRADSDPSPRSVASFDTEESLVVDPWANARSASAASARSVSERRGAWSARVVEIVDPWQRTPNQPTGDSIHLVVDPWAR